MTTLDQNPKPGGQPIAHPVSRITGFHTLFRKEWLRFWKVSVQTILAPVLIIII